MPAGSRQWGRLILAVWFILWGILAITSITFALSGVILGLMAVVGGVLWAFGRDG